LRRQDLKDRDLILPPPKRGVYSIGIHIREPLEVRIRGRTCRLETGNYLYTGSALGVNNNLHTRIRRHLLSRKKAYWHIDQITNSRHSSVFFVVFSETDRKMECAVNKAASAFTKAETPLPGFGSSDCKAGCRSHLLRLREKDSLTEITRAYESLKLNPKTLGEKGKKPIEKRGKEAVGCENPRRTRSDEV